MSPLEGRCRHEFVFSAMLRQLYVFVRYLSQKYQKISSCLSYFFFFEERASSALLLPFMPLLHFISFFLSISFYFFISFPFFLFLILFSFLFFFKFHFTCPIFENVKTFRTLQHFLTEKTNYFLKNFFIVQKNFLNLFEKSCSLFLNWLIIFHVF